MNGVGKGEKILSIFILFGIVFGIICYFHEKQKREMLKSDDRGPFIVRSEPVSPEKKGETYSYYVQFNENDFLLIDEKVEIANKYGEVQHLNDSYSGMNGHSGDMVVKMKSENAKELKKNKHIISVTRYYRSEVILKSKQ